MKNRFKLSTLMALAIFGLAQSSSAQSEFKMGYIYAMPQGTMSYTINDMHMASIEYNFMFPGRFSLGIEMNGGGYGRVEYVQPYYFEDGTSMEAHMSVNNRVTNFGLGARYLLTPAALFNPYAMAKAGLSRFSTSLYIDDPRESHTEHCPQPLMDEFIVSDNTIYFTGGAGVMIDIGRMSGAMENDRWFLDLGVAYTAGGYVQYMSEQTPNRFPIDEDGMQLVTLPFANEAQPEVVHQYHSGYLYKAALRTLDFRFSFAMRF